MARVMGKTFSEAGSIHVILTAWEEIQRGSIPAKVREPIPAAQAHENLEEMQRGNLTPFGVIKI